MDEPSTWGVPDDGGAAAPRSSAPSPTAAARAARAARLTARGSYVMARGSGRAAAATARRIRRATHAEGAGETGLGKLIELHGVSAAGDAMVAVALAGTLFFSVPIGEARGRVALYLLVTMAPFAVLAPVVGPALDRIRRGRRYAIAGTLVLRAVLAWVMAGAVAGGGEDPLRLYPAAFGTLVASRAYGVTRAAAVPRILPSGYGLVRANSRIAISGLAAGAVGAGVAVAAAKLGGPSAALWAALVVFAAGGVLALRLPRDLDAPQGDEARISADSEAPAEGRRPRVNVGHSVVTGLRANAALRAFAGFLILYLAFLLRTEPVGGVAGTTAVALVAGAMGVGGAVGTGLGGPLRHRKPEITVLTLLGATAVVCALAAWVYDLPAILLVAAASGLGQSLGKLSLDALVQRDVPEDVRASAFARSETVLQLGWVLGGGAGILLPLGGSPALALVAVLLGAATGVVWRGWRRPHARRL